MPQNRTRETELGLADYLRVTWRVVPSFGDVEIKDGEIIPKDKAWCRCAILTEGKWGSENTPVTLIPEIPMAIAEHIVALHNNSFSSTVFR